MIFWRAVTGADFFTIERGPGAGPSGGGGQKYFSISFSGLTYAELGRFLDVEPPRLIGTTRPTVTLGDVGMLTDPDVRAPLTFRPRYQPPQPDDRYYISRQNRQTQQRHPAWTAATGFPQAPDDVAGREDPRMPDLTHLKIFVARLETGEYRAGFVNRGQRPAGLPPSLAPLYAPFRRSRSAGVIALAAGELAVEQLAAAAECSGTPEEYTAVSPEVVDALELTRVAAGKRTSGQGRRADATERRAIELRAMEVAVEFLRGVGWSVDDVSLYRPYDLHCRRGDEDLRVEVKGTTADGRVVLLTPGEVRHAREHHAAVALVVVSKIGLSTPGGGTPTATGGELELVHPWDVDAGELRPTGYEYRR
jgi:hypothetical protein